MYIYKKACALHKSDESSKLKFVLLDCVCSNKPIALQRRHAKTVTDLISSHKIAAASGRFCAPPAKQACSETEITLFDIVLRIDVFPKLTCFEPSEIKLP